MSAGPIELGLCLAAFAPAGLDGALAAAARDGVRVVDLPADSTFGLVDPDRLADAGHHAELRARLAAAGVEVGCVSNSRDTQLLLGPHGPHTDPVSPGPPEAKRAHGLRAALGTVRLAAGLGAPLARLMLGVPDLARWLSWWGSEVSWQDNVDAWAEAAAPILELADESGVRVVVEPHPKQVAYDPASARALLAAADGVGLCVDPANLAATGHDPVRAVRGWGDRLAAVHAKDLQRWRDPGDPPGAGWSRYGPGPAIRFRTLGAGELPWPSIVAALLDEGYRGVLYVEHEDALLPTAQGAATSLAALRALLPNERAEGRTW
ncbi:sugar phosphate isomerase/epimerase family protein [Streptomyces mayteni]